MSQSGDIYPATRSRVIEFNLQSHPTGAKFIGFKVSTLPLVIQDQSFPPSDSLTPVRQISATKVVLNDNAPPKGETIWYSPGVELDGIEYWGDPKIYNPPDD